MPIEKLDGYHSRVVFWSLLVAMGSTAAGQTVGLLTGDSGPAFAMPILVGAVAVAVAEVIFYRKSR
jgi:hypothetical protein